MAESLRFRNVKVYATDRQHVAPVSALAVVGMRMFAAGRDGRILGHERLPKGPFNFAGPEMRTIGPIVAMDATRGKELSKMVVAAACQDPDIRFWNIDREASPIQGTPVLAEQAAHKLSGHSGLVSSVELQKSFLLSASHDGTARLWDLNVQKQVVCVGHQDGVVNALFIPDTTELVTQGLDDLIRIWDIRVAVDKPMAVLEAYLGRQLVTFALSELGHLATANECGQAHIYDIRNIGVTRAVTNFQAPSSASDGFAPITALKFVLAGRYLTCAQANGDLLVFHPDSREAKAFEVQSASSKRAITVLYATPWHKKTLLAFAAHDQPSWGFGMLEDIRDREAVREEHV